MNLSNCVIPGCGKRITYRFSLCATCEEKYGRRVEDANRPAWVNELINESRRERRAYFRDLDAIADSDDLINFSLPATAWEFESNIIAPDSDWSAVVFYMDFER